MKEQHPDTVKDENKPDKRWVLTLNNYTDADIVMLQNWTTEVSRMVASKEIGQVTENLHVQAKIWFKRAYRLTQLKKLVPRGHWELIIQGTDCLYEMKQDSEVFINVDNRRQGKRNDLEMAITALKEGSSIRDLFRDHTAVMVKYGRGMETAAEMLKPLTTTSQFTDPRWDLCDDFSKSIILWGEAGIGKTEFALQHFKAALVVNDFDDLLKFVPEVHDGIVFDDMSFKHLPREIQIHITDMTLGRSIRCRFRNAYIPANTKKIFTTNNEDGEIFNLDDSAIDRRVLVRKLCVCSTSAPR